MFRTALTVGTREASPQALVVFRDFEKDIPAIAELGYDGIEIAVFRRENVDADRLRSLLDRYGLAVPVFSTGQMSRVLGLHFTDLSAEARNRAVAVFEEIIDLAGDFGADINVSLVRGRLPEDASREEGMKRVTDCLVELCRYAERLGSSLLLEQMNRYETNYLNSAAEVGDYVRSLAIPNLKIHADTFHMNIEDRDLPETLRRYAAELGYVHFADSNRLSPGCGHLDFAAILRSLGEIGYQGWIGMEVLRVPDSREAARRSIDHLKSLAP